MDSTQQLPSFSKETAHTPYGELHATRNDVMQRVLRPPVAEPRWQEIIEHANSLADGLEMPREQFYATALIEFIEKLENARINKELNESYKNIDQEEDVAFLNHLVSHYDPRLADE